MARAKAKSRRIPAAQLSTRSRAGRRARNKGRAFEEDIARDLRDVYDSRPLLQKMKMALAKKDKLLHRALLKTSRVRRTRQADGAVQSDLNVTNCPWWFELSTAKNVNPTKKLQQAEGDVIAVGADRIPIVITREKGAMTILATMRFNTLQRLLNADKQPIFSVVVVQIDYKDLLTELKTYEAYNGPT